MEKALEYTVRLRFPSTLAVWNHLRKLLKYANFQFSDPLNEWLSGEIPKDLSVPNIQ